MNDPITKITKITKYCYRYDRILWVCRRLSIGFYVVAITTSKAANNSWVKGFFFGRIFFSYLSVFLKLPHFFSCFYVLCYALYRDSSRYNCLGHLKRPEMDRPRNSLSEYVFGCGVGGQYTLKFHKSAKNPDSHHCTKYFKDKHKPYGAYLTIQLANFTF